MLYPLKFSPILKTKIWGGERILQYHGHQLTDKALKHIGESWDVSAVPGDESLVVNGFLADNTLDELVEIYMGDLVGDKVYERFGNFFPLLVKLIDARDNLSLQVHPNDDLALQRHGERGKTEMWYVLEADTNAFIISGFKEDLERETYLKHLNDNTLESTLHKYLVKKGDLFYVPAGCVHSIGAGCLILEIQQASDLTYRIYDYNRLQENGQPRELHTELALDAIDFNSTHTNRIVPEAQEEGLFKVVDSDAFSANLIEIESPKFYDVNHISSFVILTCVEGELYYKFDSQVDSLHKGETILIPAELDGIELIPSMPSKLLEVYIKDKIEESDN